MMLRCSLIILSQESCPVLELARHLHSYRIFEHFISRFKGIFSSLFESKNIISMCNLISPCLESCVNLKDIFAFHLYYDCRRAASYSMIFSLKLNLIMVLTHNGMASHCEHVSHVSSTILCMGDIQARDNSSILYMGVIHTYVGLVLNIYC